MPIVLADNVEVHDQRARILAGDPVSERCFELLPEHDKRLIRLLDSQPTTSLRQAAVLLACNPGHLCRRAAAIRRRLRDPVVIALATRGHTLSSHFFNVGTSLFAAGRSVRAVARALHANPREIAAIHFYLRGWAAATRSNSRPKYDPDLDL